MLDRLSRLASFTGVAFAVCGVAAFATSQGPPSDDGAKIKAFFIANSTSQQISDTLWTLAFVFLVLFVGSLRSYLRRTPAAEGLSAVALAGAAMMAVGAMVYFGFDFTLAVGASSVSPDAVQAVNLLALKLVYPFQAGGLVLGIAAGLAILRGRGATKMARVAGARERHRDGGHLAHRYFRVLPLDRDRWRADLETPQPGPSSAAPDAPDAIGLPHLAATTPELLAS